MDSADVTALVTALDPGPLVTSFILFGGFILAVAGIVAGVSLVKWGIRKVRRTVSGGAA